jgi:hypothetical protein
MQNVNGWGLIVTFVSENFFCDVGYVEKIVLDCLCIQKTAKFKTFFRKQPTAQKERKHPG